MQDHEWAQALEQRRHTVRQQVSAEEWAAREDLAACYRLCVHYRMTDMTLPPSSGVHSPSPENAGTGA